MCAIQDLILIGEAADPFEPDVVRASMGAALTLPVARVAGGRRAPCGFADLRRFARQRGARIVAAEAGLGRSFEGALSGPVVLLLGEERAGLSDDLLALSDERLHLPVVGSNSSLNVAVAGSVLLYEAFRQTGLTTASDLP